MYEAIRHGVGAYNRGGQIGPARWPHHDLIVVTRGSAQFSCKGGRYRCGEGSAFWIPPNHRFVGVAGVDGCAIWVQHFRMRAAGGGVSKAPEVLPGTGESDWIRILLDRIGGLSRSGPPPFAEFEYLMPLLLAALRKSSSDLEPGSKPTTANAIQSLADSLVRSDPPLESIDSLAQRCHLSTSRFRYLYRSHTGDTIGAALRKARMHEAERLLRESNLPIKSIAVRLGYGDAVAFHRAFRRHAATTPARFRSNRCPIF